MCFSQQYFVLPDRQDSVRLKSFAKMGTNLFDAYAGVELYTVKDFTVNIETGFSVIGFKVHKKYDSYENKRNTWRMNINEDMKIYFVKSEFKWNYDFHKRHEKWKETSGNSSNYLALQVKYFKGISSNSSFYSKNSGPNNAIFTDFHWGMQREMGANLAFYFFFGYGWMYDFQTRNGVIAPSLGFKFNFHIIEF